MLILKVDLGLVVDTKSGKRNSRAIYECKCGNTLNLRKSVANKTTTQCKKCGKLQAIKKQRLLEEPKVLAKFNEVHKGVYTYPNFTYINNNIKVDIECSKHGIFKQTPHAHKAGQGCPKCGEETRSIKLRQFNTFRPAALYYVYFPDLQLYKLGVTVNLKHRFRGEKFKHEILFEKIYQSEQEAYYIEALLLTKFETSKYTGVNMLHRKGNTELLINDILNDLIVSVETIESTQEFINLSGSE